MAQGYYFGVPASAEEILQGIESGLIKVRSLEYLTPGI